VSSSPSPKQPQGRLRADSLVASVVILLLVTVVQRSVGFGRGILFCRWLTPQTLGQWEMAIGFLLLAAPLAVLGVPGSFGRYAEHFRARGHLRTFLARTMVWTAGWGFAGVAGVWILAPQFARLIFGDEQQSPMVRHLALALASVIMMHTLVSLFTALRLYRVVSVMNLAHSLLFAVISLVLAWRNPTTASLISGYVAASLLSSVGAVLWTLPAMRRLEAASESLPRGDFWPRLLKFAFFVWVTNLLSQLFTIVDRYMIVHYSGLSASEALEQVGIYHSSRVVPVMLISFADLLGGLIMPHLTHDWEQGRREHVSQRLNLAIKLTSLGLLAFSACVLASGPYLFDVVLQGRYGGGLAVLPWTLAACVWYGIFSIAQCYLWCAERTRQTALPWIVGLALNVGLNLILLPIWGLYGAVVATALSTSACLAVLLTLNHAHGMRTDSGALLAAVVPLAIGGGTLWATGATALLATMMLTTNSVISASDRQELKHMTLDAVTRALARLRPRRTAAGV
jgi:O-antigen/teichoic acid export membrane protein